MTKIIAITNHKGGVGKTTTTVNLAASLAVADKKTLMIDLDPQGSATVGMGIQREDVAISIYDTLIDPNTITKAIIHSAYSVDVIAANDDLTAAEVELLTFDDRNDRLKRALEIIKGEYDYIVIDCPPSLNVLTINALVASDSVLIPIQCEYYALEGLASLISTVEQLQTTLNTNLVIEGLVRTMYDKRNRLARDVSNQLQKHFSDKLFNAVIPRNVRLAEAPSHGQPAITYDKSSKGALAYLALAYELINGIGSKDPNLNGLGGWLKQLVGIATHDVDKIKSDEIVKPAEDDLKQVDVLLEQPDGASNDEGISTVVLEDKKEEHEPQS